jgi:signal transduction histidine kinase
MKKFFSTAKKKLHSFLIFKALVLILFFIFSYHRIDAFYANLVISDVNNEAVNVFFIGIKNTFLLLIALTIFFTAFGMYFTHKIIFKPIGYIISALDKRSIKCIKILRTIPGEFAAIGNLLQEENNQNYLLVDAKLKAEESDRLKSTFLENLTHEIRTPMNAIVGFSELMITIDLTEEEKREYIAIIHKSGKNLISIIDDLIEVSRINSNQIVPNYSNLNIDTCLEELYEAIKIDIPKTKPIDFFITKNSSYPLVNEVKVDAIKLRQVITNLVNNAIKYTNEGYVTFGYEIEEKEDFDFLKFIIKDTGIGIDKKNYKTIFERFNRIENDRAIEVGGLGLGLAISKAYIEIMGGTISIKPNEPSGTVFTIYIPLKFDKSLGINKIKNMLSREAKKDFKTILIAEDDNINYMLIKKMLEPTGHSIIRAENGEIAVTICTENNAIDLVLMDIKMPIMNGYEAYEIIKKLKPHLPVIAQTAYSTVEDKERIERHGFTAYISKPINKEKLLEEIKNHI